MKTLLALCRFGLIFLLTTALSGVSFAEDWEEIQKIVASDRAELSWFGWSVSVDGDYAIVGAFLEQRDENGGNMLYAAGGAYVFVREGGIWVEQQKLVASDRHAGAGFGYSVSLSGSYAIVGALYEPYNASGGDSLFRAGAAYIFERTGTIWTQVQKVVAPDRDEDDDFGVSVGISGSRAIVGAWKQTRDASGLNPMYGAGAAYLFERTGPGWVLQQKITSAVREYGAGFGIAVAISGNRAIVGAMDEDPGGLTDAGAAYVFRLDGPAWIQEERLVAADAEASTEFGWSVSMTGDDAAIGAYRAHYDGPGSRVNMAGAVYVYVRSDTDWLVQQQVFADYRTDGAGFGNSLSISGENLIGGCVTWRAHVFSRSGGTWGEVRQLVAHDSLMTDAFGYAVSLSGTTAMVGAPSNWLDASGGNIMSDAGAVYVFGPGSTAIRGEESNTIAGPIQLHQNFPNPFNPKTVISYSVRPSAGRDLASSGAGGGQLSVVSSVKLAVCDMLGREVVVLVNERKQPGSYRVEFDGSKFASGVYVYRLQAGDVVQTRKLVLLK